MRDLELPNNENPAFQKWKWMISEEENDDEDEDDELE